MSQQTGISKFLAKTRSYSYQIVRIANRACGYYRGDDKVQIFAFN